MLKLWFGGVPVDRKSYLVHGFGLLGVKWILDALVVYWISGEWLHPALYVIPALAGRVEMVQSGGLLAALVTSLLALPFIWIGASMSMRRARDAGWSPWIGLLFFLPLIHALVILALCLAPTRVESDDAGREGAERVSATLGMALQGIAAAAVLGVLAMIVSVFGFGEYGSGLFVGAPFVMGVVAAYLAQRGREPSRRRGISTALLAVVLCEGALLLLALEGAICLLTAAPLAMGLATVGALVGTDWAKRRSSGGRATAALILVLPLTTAIPTSPGEPKLHKAVTEVVVDAPPEVVWDHVVSFPDLSPPSDWVLKTGIAVPLRARIEGSGVGAIRYCEFSTGPFVEPITVWDRPHRLGFDVVEQPPSMSEWSPYSTIYAPHLEGTMESQRGEFLLEPLPGGKTRLVGTTWYRFNMAPAVYWTLYSDFILHRIHGRVLGHVKRLSEEQTSR
ncbi:MAG: hypothetical protein CMH55_05580 [Myxococcales bacterium]|nr:hypothetical protein [Myxococcales bacterium]